MTQFYEQTAEQTAGFRKSFISFNTGGTVRLALEQALSLQKQGSLSEAESIYRDILAREPDNVHALHLLGMIADEMGMHAEAVNLISRAVEISPDFVQAHYNLGNAFLKSGLVGSAVESYEAALKIDPTYANALETLVPLVRKLGKGHELLPFLKELEALEPESLPVVREIANTYALADMTEEAIDYYEKCIQLDPKDAGIHYNLGCLYRKTQDNVRAQIAFIITLEIDPEHTQAKNNLAALVSHVGQDKKAVELFKELADAHPDAGSYYINMSVSLRKLARYKEAFEAAQKAIELNGDAYEYHNELGATYQAFADMDKALECYEKALELKPDAIAPQKNLLFALLNMPGISSEELFQAHVEARKINVIPGASEKTFPNKDRSPDRKLKVAYISSDFKTHVVCGNVSPLILNHDHDDFEVFLYAQVDNPDPVSQILKDNTHHWKSTVDYDDATVARWLEEDGIDIAVFLAGRFNGNRPTIAAHRAAPVQISYHDCATTGLAEMDYFLTDNFLHPEDTPERFTEELYRLPIFYQYQKKNDFPEISPLPAKTNGHITFGVFNKPEKANEEVVSLWADVVKAVPGSKLFLKYFDVYQEAEVQERWVKLFAKYGITKDRLIFHNVRLPRSHHLDVMAQADICLDTFPFNGATTTYDSITMGLPVVCLTGRHFVDRVAASLVTHLGRPEFAAGSREEYVRIARDLASNLDGLAEIRSSLRQELLASPICDEKAYAKSVEDAYRDMWRRWCDTQES